MRIPILAVAALLASCGDQPMDPIWVSGPTGALAVDDGGPPSAQPAGQPVVFVHSLAGNSGHWARQLKHLRQDRRALALDLRGHGRSEPPKNGDYTIEGMASDIAAVVDTLGLEQFSLVGHSMGGGAALTYAAAHPHRIVGLVLVDPIGDGKQIPAAESNAFLGGLESDYADMIQKYWTSIAGPDSAVREHLLADLRATPREAVLRGLRSVMRFDPSPALTRYQGPKLAIVTPNNDQSFSLHRLGTGFPHRVVQETGHWIHLDKPDEINRMLDEFLRQKSVSGK